MSFNSILVDHNLIWGKHEFLILAGLAIAAGLIVCVAARKHHMGPGRGLALWCLMVYLGMIFCAVVFFRPVIGSAYELDPFVEWQRLFDAITNGDSYSAGYWSVEIVINLLMLVPVGLLLPLACGRRVSVWLAFFIGACVSLIIETLQFTTDVGLFHTADVLHNALGCAVGCVVGCWLGGYRKPR